MARKAQDREDLLRDARALLPRARLGLLLDGARVEVFVGFRGPALSVYFGADPAYHFNALAQLRRAFIAERLIKAERGGLVSLARRESAAATLLVRRELDAEDQRRLLDDLERRLAVLHQALAARTYEVLGEIPAGGECLARLSTWLATRPPLAPAASPRVNADG